MSHISLETKDKLIEEKLSEASGLLQNLRCFDRVDGAQKLERKIKQEIKFLQKILKQKATTKTQDHLSCSNLLHLGALVKSLTETENPVSTLKVFTFDSGRKITVDVVANGGHLWIKVIARNAKALVHHSRGDQPFGQRSVLDQASEWVACASQNPVLFKNPQIKFIFRSGITENLKYKLENRGISVEGQVTVCSEESYSESDDESVESDASSNPPSQEVPSECTLNLDITAMIAYVSALTNGQCNYIFKEPILSQQASWERASPVKPYLDKLFKGNRLICCESAVRDFRDIVQTLGGPGEKLRSKILLDEMISEIVPDVVSDRVRNLELSGKIKERSRAIFGTGDQLNAITVTANSGFVRAAQGQGVHLAVVMHESRALTEGKMTSSVRIPVTEIV